MSNANCVVDGLEKRVHGCLEGIAAVHPEPTREIDRTVGFEHDVAPVSALDEIDADEVASERGRRAEREHPRRHGRRDRVTAAPGRRSCATHPSVHAARSLRPRGRLQDQTQIAASGRDEFLNQRSLPPKPAASRETLEMRKFTMSF
jgi:hypothetical protein